MFARWWGRVGLACSLACYPFALQGQEKSLPQQIADELVLLAGGIHPGYRFMHAKGMIVTGTFTAAAGASAISRAAHLRGGTVPVTVRFSDGTGVPNIPDTDPNAGPRGIAIRFMLPGGAYTDIVSVSHNGFVVGSGEDFLAFLKAIAATRPDSPHPSPVEAFLGAHPRALQFVIDNKPLPASFANLAYYGCNAFVFVDAKGTKRAGRYQIVPAAGLANLDSAAAARAGPNYLFDELASRLAGGPVQFRLFVQLANPGDQTKDGSAPWPDDRKRVELGTITLTTVAPNNEEVQRSLTYNPVYLTDGIQLSDDPVVPLRSAVYALSVAHRRDTPSPTVPATPKQLGVDPTWLSFDTTAKSVRFQLIAGLTGLNGALNFNGFRDGQLTLVAPLGWQTEIDFRNHDGLLPHSAVVIAAQTPLPTQPVTPAIPRAFTLRLAEGLPSEATDEMRFGAQPAGEYVITCGVPGHGAAGMWIRLRVSATAQTPTMQLTPAAGSPSE